MAGTVEEAKKKAQFQITCLTCTRIEETEQIRPRLKFGPF